MKLLSRERIFKFEMHLGKTVQKLEKFQSSWVKIKKKEIKYRSEMKTTEGSPRNPCHFNDKGVAAYVNDYRNKYGSTCR